MSQIFFSLTILVILIALEFIKNKKPDHQNDQVFNSNNPENYRIFVTQKFTTTFFNNGFSYKARTREKCVVSVQSGRLDLNQRPLDPQSSALTGLRYAPKFLFSMTVLSVLFRSFCSCSSSSDSFVSASVSLSCFVCS